MITRQLEAIDADGKTGCNAFCVECIFYLRAPSVLPHAHSINGTSLTSSEKVNYLDLFLTPSPSWGAHIINVFIRGQKLASSLKRVRSAGAPRDKLLLFIDTLIISIFLYCSPVIFPALLEHLIHHRLVFLLVVFVERCNVECWCWLD